MAITVISVSSGFFGSSSGISLIPAASSRSFAVISSRSARASAAPMVHSSTVASPVHTCCTPSRFRASPMAMRRISRRRRYRTARIASAESSCRDSSEAISALSAAAPSGCKSATLSSQVMEVGASSSRSVMYRELESMWHSRSAAAGESRSMRKYQLVVPSDSETMRNPSSPASASTPSANHPRSTGIKCR